MRLILALIFVGFSLSLVYGQTNQTESLTFTTYYPAPYGVYRNLKLINSTEPAGVPEAGMIYYDQNYHVVRYRNNQTWVNVTGGSGGGSSESYAVLTRSCPWGYDANGRMVSEGLGCGDQCYLTPGYCCSPPACPANWTDAGTTIKLASVDAPKNQKNGTNEVGYEWQNGFEEAFNRPVSVGNVLRTCVKKGAAVITLSKPWRSDHTAGVNNGWGNQCTAPNYSNCSGPAPSCPVNWTYKGTDVQVYAVACPRVWDNKGEGCFWGDPWSVGHPAAAGSLVTICEKNSTN